VCPDSPQKPQGSESLTLKITKRIIIKEWCMKKTVLAGLMSFFLNAAKFTKNMHAHMCTLIVGLLTAELADTVDPFSVLLDQLLGWYGGK
jgi:hypothetical protein